jgi:hypothetical protein
MDTIGLDLHKRESQLCILTVAREQREIRIATTRDRFTAVLGRRPARILLEAATESEWVARHPANWRRCAWCWGRSTTRSPALMRCWRGRRRPIR